MIRSKDNYAAKVVEQLEKENLCSSDELSVIEEYLCGDVGDEVLDKFSYRDLSNMAEPQIINDVYANLLGKGRNEDARRLEEIMFAMGEASCYKMFSQLAFNPQRSQDSRPSLEPAKFAAVQASILGKTRGRGCPFRGS